MKVIFLDFDGVITTEWSSFKIEHEKIKLLNRLIEETGAKVVVSSAWRYRDGDPVKSLQEQLEGHGFKGEVISITNLNWEDRGKEIDDWVREHDIESYVVIDDDVADIVGYKCADFLIKTNMQEGLTDDVVEVAKALLKGGR